VTPQGRRLALFLIFCAAGVAGILAYVQFVYRPRMERTSRATATAVTVNASDRDAYNGRAHVVFVNTSLDEYNDRLAVSPLDALTGSRFVANLRCERVHLAARVGLCLNADRGVLTRYYGYFFDQDFNQHAEFPLLGTPSRARMSPDGRLGAVTVFVAGDSYANNSFSTRTTILDAASAQVIGELEQFTTTKDGQPFHAADFNYWGVTFAHEPGVFYATLSTGGHMWLVRGSVPRREMTVIYDGVECPSLSPDDSKVVFKKREIKNGRLGWRLHVLTLQTLTAVPIADERSVDDQAEWLDQNHVLYALPRAGGGTSLWSATADGSGAPVEFLDNAYSPAIVQPQ
jgi:hypothetical protein